MKVFGHLIKGKITQNGYTGYCQDELYFSQRSTTSQSLGATGAFAIILLIAAGGFLFAAEGILAMAGAIVGLIIAWLLGLTSMPWYYISAALCFVIIIALIGRNTKRR